MNEKSSLSHCVSLPRGGLRWGGISLFFGLTTRDRDVKGSVPVQRV
jgi:hypothetical protein